MFRAHRPLAPFVLHSMVTMRTFVTMRTLLIAAMSGLAVLIVGCSTAPFVGYKNGPVTLYIGDVRHVCAASGNNNRGCTVRYPNGRIEVYCADGVPTRERLAALGLRA